MVLSVSLTGSEAPEFSRLHGWLNSPPLTMKGLKGRVVFLDFWTFGCINCVRTLPHVKSVYEKFSGEKFMLIGVHTPEFEFEKSLESVADAVKRFQIKYPLAIDNENATWKLYGNEYWPRQTLVDAQGWVRWEHAGEGDYEVIEETIRKMLG
ncbi:redoxin domain-containing protein [Candidatus Bathyarchaeota archaeon]|nr:redoxin domain-containing protein [Candidatus Bathyarchaeota archaeon]